MSIVSSSEGLNCPVSPEVVERLRESKQRCFDQAKQNGQDVGQFYATKLAEADELELLEALVEEIRSYSSLREWLEHESGDSPADRVYLILYPGDGDDSDAAVTFWNDVTDGHPYLAKRVGFLVGFIEAAVGVWKKVNSDI